MVKINRGFLCDGCGVISARLREGWAERTLKTPDANFDAATGHFCEVCDREEEHEIFVEEVSTVGRVA